jgi:coenzyme F420-dependent glucose-6-phosphate dehydrogenase
MTRIGYHASHEQFTPRDLLDLAVAAEAAGFDSVMSSDHFHPWSEKQGQSGFAWSWLGAAMQATSLPFGIISAPGYRYHPAVLAQAAATLLQMYPQRLWWALGSGQAINEAITGMAWPDKAERNARLLECVDVIRALFAGETVTHRGRVTVVEAKLYSRPAVGPLLLGGAVTLETSRWVGTWADGLITVNAAPSELAKVINAFREGGGEGKPVYVQAAVAYAPAEAEAEAAAREQWGPNCAGGEVNWDLRRPGDFDRIARLVRVEDVRQTVLISSDLSRHRAWIEDFVELGVEEVILHEVGRNQRRFIEAFGERILPDLQHRQAT